MVPVTFKVAKTPGGDLHFLGSAIALFGLLAGLIAALLSVSWHPLVWAALSIVVLVGYGGRNPYRSNTNT